MSVAGQLDVALRTRIRLENEFKQNVINRITAILQSLRDCDRTGLTPAAAATLDLTQDQLDNFIHELTNPNNLTDEEAQRIANTVDRNDLRRIGGPTRALPARLPIPPTGATTGATGASSGWFSSLWRRPAPSRALASQPRLSGTELSELRRPSRGDEDDAGGPSWARDPSSRGSSILRNSSVARVSNEPSWLNDPNLGTQSRGDRVGGWKSPRKRKPRKPRGTKKYHSKV